MTPRRRYCEMCDVWLPAAQTVCKACGMPTLPAVKTLPMSPLERELSTEQAYTAAFAHFSALLATPSRQEKS